MPESPWMLAAALVWPDWVIIAVGAVVLVYAVGRWWRGGGHDPLRGAPIRANRLSPLWLLACLAAHLLGVEAGYGLATLTAPDSLSPTGREAWEQIAGANFMQIAVAVTCAVVMGRTFTASPKRIVLGRLGLRGAVVAGVAGALVAMSLCPLIALATKKLIQWVNPSFHEPVHVVFKALEDPSLRRWMRVIAFGGAVVLAPVGEELFFRGVIQTVIKKLVTPRPGSVRHRWIAVAVSAAVFGGMHMSMPQHIPALIVLGVILGFLYERYGSLLVPILVHVLFNAKSLVWYYLG